MTRRAGSPRLERRQQKQVWTGFSSPDRTGFANEENPGAGCPDKTGCRRTLLGRENVAAAAAAVADFPSLMVPCVAVLLETGQAKSHNKLRTAVWPDTARRSPSSVTHAAPAYRHDTPLLPPSDRHLRRHGKTRPFFAFFSVATLSVSIFDPVDICKFYTTFLLSLATLQDPA